MSMKHRVIIVFLDTNSLLHYPCIQDTDWRSLCDADLVRLMLSRQVIAELDEKKSHPTLRERAERTISEIRALLKGGGQVRNKVTIATYNKDLSFSQYPVDLNPDSQDDRIICHAMKCAEENAPVHVAIVSEDLGMEVRCEAFNIEVITPPRASRLPNPTTDIERERDKAVRELNQLRSKTPDIRIRISPTKENFEDQCKLSLCKPKFAPIDIASKIAALRRELTIAPPKPHSPADKSELSSFFDRVTKSYLAIEVGPSDEEYARYERDLESYLDAYRQYLESEVLRRQTFLRAFKFWIKIENNGNTPATELQITLQLKPSFQAFFTKSQHVGNRPVQANEPKKPTPPRGPMTLPDFRALSDDLRTLDMASGLYSSYLADAPNVSLKGDEASGFVLYFSISKLSHHKPIVLGPVLGIFKSPEMVKPFQIEVTVTADNLPTAKNVTLNALIGERSGS